jgi:hypothetical protein
MTPTEKAVARRDTFSEIIAAYDQLLELYRTGYAATLTGHAYDPKDFDREAALVKNLKKTLVGMRNREVAKVAEGGA